MIDGFKSQAMERRCIKSLFRYMAIMTSFQRAALLTFPKETSDRLLRQQNGMTSLPATKTTTATKMRDMLGGFFDVLD